MIDDFVKYMLKNSKTNIASYYHVIFHSFLERVKCTISVQGHDEPICLNIISNFQRQWSIGHTHMEMEYMNQFIAYY